MINKKNKKGVVAPVIIVIGFIIFSGILIYSNSNNINTGTIVNLDGGFQCYDSDGGINYGLKGYTQLSKPSANYLGSKIYDYCADTKNLVESGCKNKQIIECPFGCADGKCNDNPTNIKKCPAGTTDYYCNELGGISICNKDTGLTTTYNCQTYQICQNGKCVKKEDAVVSTTTSTVKNTESCTDSDNGKNINIKGKTNGIYVNGNTYEFNDFCSVTDKSKVSEGFCVDLGNGEYRSSSEWITCPLNSLCQDGVCVSETDVKTCSQNGGTCRSLCNLGEINIGILDCDGDLCCKKGEIGECPAGTAEAYCNPNDKSEPYYYKCKSGLTVQYTCRDGFVCSDGEDCFHEGIFPSGDTVGDVVGEIGNGAIKDIFRGLFGDSWKTILIVVIVVVGAVLLLISFSYIMVILQTIRGFIPR